MGHFKGGHEIKSIVIPFTIFFLLTTTTAFPQNFWQQTSGPRGGEVRAIAVNVSGDIFAGHDGGGVYRSSDNGASWTAINNSLTNDMVNALVIHREVSGAESILAGTLGGVFRSTDNGANWTQINNNLTNLRVRALAINTAGDIFTGTEGGGVFRSTDNGANWTAVNTSLTDTFVQALMMDNTTGVIWAGTLSGGVFRASTSDMRWVATNTGFSPPLPTIRSLAINASGNVFAGTNSGVYRLLSTTASWVSRSIGLTNTNIASIYVHSNGDVFAGTEGGGIFRSTDNGDNWSAANAGLSVMIVQAFARSVAGPTASLFAGTTGGMFRSTDGGANWTEINSGIIASKIAALAISPITGSVFAGTAAGRVFRTKDDGTSWTLVSTGLPNDRVQSIHALAVSPTTGDVFAGTAGDGVYQSSNDGNTWTLVNNSPETNFLSLAINASGHIFAGGASDGISRSTDNGNTWDYPGLGSLMIRSLAISASSDIFAGTSSGIYRSADNGDNWTALTNGLPASPDIHTVAVSPNGEIFASVPGGAMYRSKDNGASWNAASTGLPSSTTEALAANAADYVFAGTNGSGVYRTIDSGANWSAVNTGLTPAIIQALAINATSYAFAGTYAGGVYRSVNPTAPPTAPSGLTVTAISNTQIDLAWTDNSTVEDGFKIERKTGAAGTYAEITQVGVNVVSFSNTGLSASTQYFYRVRAYNVSGNSAYSAEVNATTLPDLPVAPSGLTATAVSNTQIDLAWTDNSSSEDGFKIESKTGAAGTYAEIFSTAVNATSYSNTGLSASTEYFYRVRAFTAGGNNSAYSNEASATTLLEAPSGLTATVISNTQINLAWTDNSSSEDGFKIERKTGAAGTYAEIFSTAANATSYSNTGLSASTQYFYRVRAFNAAVNSVYSNEASATTLLEAPSGLTATAISNTQINLAWTDNSSSEDGFKIERKTGAAGTYAEIFSTAANATSYSNTGLSASTQYFYRVRAFNAAVNSVYSNEASATTLLDPGPIVSFSFDSLKYGNVEVNSNTDLTVRLTNTGAADLSLSSLNLTGIDAEQFSIANGGGAGALAPNTFRDITLRFSPASAGSKIGYLVLVSNAASSPDTVALIGAGFVPRFTFAPKTLDFGAVRINASADLAVTLTNPLNVDITIRQMAIIAVDAPHFSIANGGGAQVLPANSSKTITLRFSPQTRGSKFGALEIISTLTAVADTVNLIGSGIEPLVTFSSTNLDFGVVGLGANSNQTVSLTNSGTANLAINFVDLAGANAADFSITAGGVTGTLAPNAPRNMALRFAPQTAGAKTAALVITTDAASNPDTVFLSGTGVTPALSLSSHNVDFKNIWVGTHGDQTITLINTGLVNLNITGTTLLGAPANTFLIMSGGALTMPPNASHNISLRFTPQSTGAKTASLIITSSAASIPDTVKLFGSGSELSVQVSESGNPLTGTTVNLTVGTLANFQPTSRMLFYRPAGETPYDSLIISGSGNNFSADIPPEAVTLRGVEFYVRLSDGQTAVTFPGLNARSKPHVIRVRIAEHAVALPFEPNTYRMISTPVDLDDTGFAAVLEEFAEYDTLFWRLFRWENNAYAEYSDIDSAFTPGNAFWLITRGGDNFGINDALSVDSGQPFTLTLQPGWNQIANPFAFPVAWSSVQASGQVDTLAFWDGVEYQYNITVLEPWEGYFLFNLENTPVTLTIPPIAATPNAINKTPKRNLAANEYLLQMSAQLIGTKIIDTQNYVGLLNEARLGRDAADFGEAPAIGDYIQLSIVDGQQRFAGNFKPANGDGQEWDIEIRARISANVAKKLQISLQESGALPEGFQRFVLDKDFGAIIPLQNETFRVELNDKFAVRHFKIIAGTKAFAESHNEGIPLVPLDYGLEQNYPNPFTINDKLLTENLQTTIRYQLSKRSPVILEIRNTLGQRVRTLVDGVQNTGAHRAVWEGLDEAGRSVANGVYFYTLKAETFTATRKLILTR